MNRTDNNPAKSLKKKKSMTKPRTFVYRPNDGDPISPLDVVMSGRPEKLRNRVEILERKAFLGCAAVDVDDPRLILHWGEAQLEHDGFQEEREERDDNMDMAALHESIIHFGPLKDSNPIRAYAVGTNRNTWKDWYKDIATWEERKVPRAVTELHVTSGSRRLELLRKMRARQIAPQAATQHDTKTFETWKIDMYDSELVNDAPIDEALAFQELMEYSLPNLSNTGKFWEHVVMAARTSDPAKQLLFLGPKERRLWEQGTASRRFLESLALAPELLRGELDRIGAIADHHHSEIAFSILSQSVRQLVWLARGQHDPRFPALGLNDALLLDLQERDEFLPTFLDSAGQLPGARQHWLNHLKHVKGVLSPLCAQRPSMWEESRNQDHEAFKTRYLQLKAPSDGPVLRIPFFTKLFATGLCAKLKKLRPSLSLIARMLDPLYGPAHDDERSSFAYPEFGSVIVRQIRARVESDDAMLEALTKLVGTRDLTTYNTWLIDGGRVDEDGRPSIVWNRRSVFGDLRPLQTVLEQNFLGFKHFAHRPNQVVDRTLVPWRPYSHIAAMAGLDLGEYIRIISSECLVDWSAASMDDKKRMAHLLAKEFLMSGSRRRSFTQALVTCPPFAAVWEIFHTRGDHPVAEDKRYHAGLDMTVAGQAGPIVGPSNPYNLFDTRTRPHWHRDKYMYDSQLLADTCERFDWADAYMVSRSFLQGAMLSMSQCLLPSAYVPMMEEGLKNTNLESIFIWVTRQQDKPKDRPNRLLPQGCSDKLKDRIWEELIKHPDGDGTPPTLKLARLHVTPRDIAVVSLFFYWIGLAICRGDEPYTRGAPKSYDKELERSTQQLWDYLERTWSNIECDIVEGRFRPGTSPFTEPRPRFRTQEPPSETQTASLAAPCSQAPCTEPAPRARSSPEHALPECVPCTTGMDWSKDQESVSHHETQLPTPDPYTGAPNESPPHSTSQGYPSDSDDFEMTDLDPYALDAAMKPLEDVSVQRGPG